MRGKTKDRSIWWIILIPIAAALAAMCIGRYVIPVKDILRSLGSKITGQGTLGAAEELTLWKTRLPRIFLALIVGGGLSAAGAAYQSLFANPLATPDTLGVASGACFGASLAMLFGLKLAGIQVVSFLFGLLAVGLTFLAGSGKHSRGLSGIVLAGIMIGSLFNALISLIKFTADTENQLPVITYFLMGSLNGAGFEKLMLGAPPVLIGTVVLFLIRWRLNLLPLSQDEIRSTGVNVKALRITTVVCSTMITASCISMCGQVGWVGLLVPHMCRMLFGNDQTRLIPASVCIGAAFLVIVDTLARSITAAEIPVSVLTAIIGAPFFIILLRRSEGWQL